jgi:opacity protein-like surface antigen
MGRYFIGKRKFIMDDGMTGASELAFGVSYTGLFKRENDRLPNDSALSRLSVTPAIGFVLSRIRKPGHPDSYSPRTSLAPGIRLEYKLGSSMSLISGLSFERKGYHLNDSSYFYYRHALASWTTYQVNTTTDLDYAVIPLMMKLGTGSGTRVYVAFGAYLGIKLNARVTGTADYESSSLYGYYRNRIDVYDDIQGLIKNTDWGWITGAGVEVPLTNEKKLEIGVQYASGKENILENDGDYGTSLSESDELIRNGSLQIHVGLMIPIRKSN